jgi:hypothetical protein
MINLNPKHEENNVKLTNSLSENQKIRNKISYKEVWRIKMDRNFLDTAAQQIGKIIGQPIDPNLPVPQVLAEIADVENAQPGEEVKKYYLEDTNGGDSVYSVDSTGAITLFKVTPQTPAVIPFSTIQSRGERVHLDDILNSPDQSVMPRRKASITRAMDSLITKQALDLILALDGQSGRPNQEVAVSGDLYDTIMAMKHRVEDYGDNYILLVGSAVNEAADVYDKVNALNFNYRIGLFETLKQYGIQKVKIPAGVQFELDGGSPTRVLAADKLILVARNSTITTGKPLVHVRRIISPAIAQMAGLEVENAVRASYAVPLPVNVSGVNTLAYMVGAVEQRVATLLNYRAVCWATLA